jgi:N-acetylglutamate synthase-like GNAT family acetyltransferase
MQFQAQQHHYLTRFPDASYQVILRDDTPVGRIYVHKREDHIQILDVSILPEHRNAGIGTALISDVLVKAARLSVPVRIYVESFNRSLRLFERLGFSKVDESSIHFLLEWRPQV